MKIISFAWTVDALLEGRKTVTRRFWTRRYARRFHKGDLVAAWDRSPRARSRKGPQPKKVATIRLTAEPCRRYLWDVTDEDEKREGGQWGSAEAFKEMMLAQGKGDIVWVIEFEVAEKGGGG